MNIKTNENAAATSGADGGSPTSSTEVPTSVETSAAAGVDDLFGDLNDSFDTGFDELEAGESDAAEGQDAAPAAKVPDPSATNSPTAVAAAEGTPAATAAAVVPPTEGAQAAPVPAQAAAPAAAAAPEPTAKSFADQMTEMEKTVVPELAKLYELPQEFASKFTAEQQAPLKQLAGMLHFNVLRAASAMMERMMPDIIERHSSAKASVTEAEQQFFTAWPQLKAEHRPVIQKYAGLWAKANPQGKLPDFIQAVGAMSAQELGLLTAQVAPQQQKAPAGQQAPTTRIVPFAPANGQSPAGGGQRKTPATGDDLWASLYETLNSQFE